MHMYVHPLSSLSLQWLVPNYAFEYSKRGEMVALYEQVNVKAT